MNKKILEAIKNMMEVDRIALWNDYCDACNYPDDRIFDAWELSEMVEWGDTLTWLNRFYFGSDDDGGKDSSANPNRDYFTFNGYGNIISFSYTYNEYSDEFYNMDGEALADYIAENKEDFGNDKIAEILEEVNED